jgi:hypothetical protein
MFFMKSVRGKLTALFAAVSVVATLAVGGYFLYSTISDNDKLVADYRQQLAEHYDRELRLQTEGIVSSLNGIYARQQSGELTEAQAKSLALDVLRSVRYDEGKGYFFADEKDTGSDHSDNRILPLRCCHPGQAVHADSARLAEQTAEGRLLVYHRLALHVHHLLLVLLSGEQVESEVMDSRHTALCHLTMSV